MSQSVDEFTTEAAAWLAENGEPRPAAEQSGDEVTWGEGEFSVSVFHNMSHDEELELGQTIAKADEEAALAALPPFYRPIMKASQAYEVDAALIRAIIMAESSYNPKAVSHRGAQGLMQLMPTTARWLGIRANPRRGVAIIVGPRVEMAPVPGAPGRPRHTPRIRR